MLKKTNQAWIWIALCRKTRQVVTYAIGDRSQKTCLILWKAIPQAYRAAHCFTDFWSAYQAVLPEDQHTAVGKETGETAHIERWNGSPSFRGKVGEKSHGISSKNAKTKMVTIPVAVPLTHHCFSTIVFTFNKSIRNTKLEKC